MKIILPNKMILDNNPAFELILSIPENLVIINRNTFEYLQKEISDGRVTFQKKAQRKRKTVG